MTHEEHRLKHIALHNSLDELLADWIIETGSLPSKSSVLELLEWSHSQTINPSPLTRDYLKQGESYDDLTKT